MVMVHLIVTMADFVGAVAASMCSLASVAASNVASAYPNVDVQLPLLALSVVLLADFSDSRGYYYYLDDGSCSVAFPEQCSPRCKWVTLPLGSTPPSAVCRSNDSAPCLPYTVRRVCPEPAASLP